MRYDLNIQQMVRTEDLPPMIFKYSLTRACFSSIIFDTFSKKLTSTESEMSDGNRKLIEDLNKSSLWLRYFGHSNRLNKI